MSLSPLPTAGGEGPGEGFAVDAIRDFYTTYASVINFIGLNAILGLSLYITLSCGLLSLANAAFMGMGASRAALLTPK